MKNNTIKTQILEEVSVYVDLLQSMWVRMFEPTACDEYLLRLKDHINLFFTDLINESEQKEQIIMDEITKLRTEVNDLNCQLHRSVFIDKRTEGMSLVMWQLQLDNSVENLRKDLNERQAEIFELLLQQEQLCLELGERPLPLTVDPLPMEDELFEFRGHLQEMRKQRELLLNEINELRQQIKEDMKTLELLPNNENEEQLLNANNHNLTPETFGSLQKLHKMYKTQVDEMKNGINMMFEKIEMLWLCLGEQIIEPRFRKRVEDCKSKYNQRTFDILREELQRCQNLRSQNLQCFMENLRVEFSKWCELTLKSDQERRRFNIFYNDFCNEDLLDLYELELDQLKHFYQKNKTIFELYERRIALWTRMEALEAKANEPGRFTNRGGQLLKEERERKAIGSKLGKIEQEISELVQAYQHQECVPFLVYGKNILERIAEDWETKKKNRPGKMLPPPTTLTRTPMAIRNVSSSTLSLKKTPSKVKLVTSSTGHSLTSGSSINSVNDHTAFKAKQNSLAKTSTKSPLRRVHVLENTLRRSGGLGRRNNLAKNRNTAKVAIQLTTDDELDYSPNENCLPETYRDLEQSPRSFRMPLGLRQPKAKPSKVNKKLDNDYEKRCQPNFPDPREGRMWRP